MKRHDIKKLKVKIKKDIKNFMKDESGFMTKENILKVGMGTIAALAMFSGVAKAGPPACNNQFVHTSDNTLQWTGNNVGVKTIIPSHTHHAAHCSY
jgi:hypothetical protein